MNIDQEVFYIVKNSNDFTSKIYYISINFLKSEAFVKKSGLTGYILKVNQNGEIEARWDYEKGEYMSGGIFSKTGFEEED